MKNKRPVLAIDARPLARGRGGIQRYLQKLIPLILNEDKYKIILYSDKPIQAAKAYELGCHKIRHVYLSRFATVLWHICAPIWIRQDKVDVYWSPRHHLPFFVPSRCQTVVTIHDFVWKTTPETMPRTQLLSEKVLMPLAIKRASKIICISETTKKQLISYYSESTQKSRVILHGNDIKTEKHSRAVPNQPFFLTVGTLEPRKNYIRLIEAFDDYATKCGTMNLIIVGKDGWNFRGIYQILNQTKHRDRITVLNDADDKQLIGLYQTASGFISASLDEGYGLPPQEAALFGLPMLLSRIDVYLELYPFADFWADPLSIEDLVIALFQLEKIEPKSYSKNQLPRKNWSTCAKEHVEFFDCPVE